MSFKTWFEQHKVRWWLSIPGMDDALRDAFMAGRKAARADIERASKRKPRSSAREATP